MRLISFPAMAAQPLLALPAQVLTPWIARLRNSLHGISLLPDMRQPEAMALPAFLVNTAAESANSDFNVIPATAQQRLRPASPARRAQPLRVVREADRGIAPDCAGRMVISGRMADVCAELDRMALQASVTS